MRPFRATALQSAIGLHATLTSSSLLVASRGRSTRAIPWVPAGTVLDYSASAKHQGLNEMQHQIDVAAGRVPKDILPTNGPVVMGSDGQYHPLSPGQHTSVRGRPNLHQRPIHDRSKPHSMSAGGEQNFGYADDMEMSPHEELSLDRSIRERLKNLESDGFGPQRRGVVPPPPPPAPDAPRAYSQPQPTLGRAWYGIMGGIGVTFFLMSKYGR